MLILYQYFFKRRYGLWIPIKQKQYIGKSGRQVDDSMSWRVKFLNFGLTPEQKPITIPKGSKIFSFFSGVTMLDIYDSKLNHISHYYNPKILTHQEGKDLHHGIGYYFMLRYSSELESVVEATSFIQIEEKPYNVDETYDIGVKDCYDETMIQKESKSVIQKIVQKMDQEYYFLDQIVTSDIRRSFPTDMLINELFLELEPGTKIIILVTNKKSLFGLERSIEFNSEEKPFTWNPEGKENFCSLVLEGPEIQDEYEEDPIVDITVSEFLYCESSKLLPIIGLVFVQGE